MKSKCATWFDKGISTDFFKFSSTIVTILKRNGLDGVEWDDVMLSLVKWGDGEGDWDGSYSAQTHKNFGNKTNKLKIGMKQVQT